MGQRGPSRQSWRPSLLDDDSSISARSPLSLDEHYQMTSANLREAENKSLHLRALSVSTMTSCVRAVERPPTGIYMEKNLFSTASIFQSQSYPCILHLSALLPLLLRGRRVLCRSRPELLLILSGSFFRFGSPHVSVLTALIQALWHKVRFVGISVTEFLI